MTPYEQVEELFRQHPEEGTFAEVLVDYLANGYVFSTPTLFLMGKPDAKMECWNVHTFAGRISEVFDYMPFHLPFISFCR